jgi:hypothetical protein
MEKGMISLERVSKQSKPRARCPDDSHHLPALWPSAMLPFLSNAALPDHRWQRGERAPP